jgi:ABC-type multidrug transport system fused ATPase/permease subunit
MNLNMTVRTKILLVILTFVLTLFVGSSFAYPAFLEEQGQAAEIKNSSEELALLSAKLNKHSEEEKRTLSLKGQIEFLRNAVPKDPELDLLVLDLEKMCAKSDVDLVSVEAPEQEALQKLTSSSQDVKEVLNANQGKSLGSKSLKQSFGETSEANNNNNQKNVANKEEDQSNGLKETIKQVYITGTFQAMLDFLDQLEKYERVVGISQLSIGIPEKESGTRASKASAKANKLSLEQPLMCFLLRVYYLP